jgi:chorismate mutase/prephenate dehydrogenase
MTLHELRDRLSEVDREILEAVARRQSIVVEVSAEKHRRGQPTRDFEREKQVLQAASAISERLDLPPGLARDLMRLLIRSSLTEQERDRVAAHGMGTGKRALVIGGAGRMGRWFVDYLDAQGFGVEVLDPAGPVAGFPYLSGLPQEDLDHDLVVIAAPLRETERILRALAERPPPGLVFDIGSVKGPLRSALAALSSAGGKVASIHPMFGPDTALLSGRHIIFVDVGDPQATEEARMLFEPTMAELVEMSFDRHDGMIAYVLGLSHALNIAFFTVLDRSGAGAAELTAISSTTFDAQISIASQLAGENPRLYFEIQSLNEAGGEVLDHLAAVASELRSVVRAGDEDGFVALMDRGRRYVDILRPADEATRA